MTKTSTAISLCVSSVLSVGLISAANAESNAAVADIVAIGPLEFVDANSVTVFGRGYHVEDTSGLAVGEKIAIHGNLQPDGSVANAWAESMGSYTPGSDTVFEAGIVTSVDETFGDLAIGDSKIDYTQAMSDPTTSVPNQGELVAVTGIQPELGGVVLGTQTRSGVQAVAMAIAGITGSNRSTAGITGSNQATAGITGSNQATAGITGSNRTAAGITGSNQATAGITGSNQVSAGITGSNQSTAGITGSNQASAGITGSNARTLGITGSNSSQ